MKYAQIYTLVLMLICHTSCGQNQTNVPQDNISNGLYSGSQVKEAATSKVPMSMVRNVKQARNGDILIASYLSVFRYDGTSFTNLTGKIISPRFSSFWDVLEDRKGNLWFASKDSGVYYYPSASVRAGGKSLPTGQAGFQHFTTKDGLASNKVVKIFEDKSGNIWFATGGGGSRYDGKSFRNFTTKEGLSNNGLTTIMEDKTGKLWFGTRGEPCFYDGKIFTVFTNNGKPFKNIRSIIEDKKGNIWLGGSDGLWRYDPSASLRAGGSTFTNFTKNFVGHIYEDRKGNIWTTGEVIPNKPNIGKVWALSRYDAKSLYSKKPTVTEIKSHPAMLLGILEEPKGNIWFGSGGGVYRYDGKTVTDFKSKEDQK